MKTRIILFICLLAGCTSMYSNEVSDPHTSWYQGFLLVEAATQLEKEGNLEEAIAKVEQAQSVYIQLHKRFPEFQPDIISGRIKVLENQKNDLWRKFTDVPEPDSPFSISRGHSSALVYALIAGNVILGLTCVVLFRQQRSINEGRFS